MVPAPRSWRSNSAVVCGPTSSAISSAAMPSASATREGAPAAASRATTTSVGITSRPCVPPASARISPATVTSSPAPLERADLVALGGEERVGHGAADQHRVGDGEHVPDEADLVGDLEAAQDHDERPRRVAQQAPEDLDLLGHEQAGDRRQVVRDALGGGVRPVRRAERVVDVDLAERRELPRELRVVAGLLRVEAQVLEQEHVAGRAARPPPARPRGRRSRPRSRPGGRAARRGAPRPEPCAARPTTWPLGRPRWDMSTIEQPWSSRYWMVGRAARMRVSSTTRPSRQRHVEVHAHERALARERVVGERPLHGVFSLPGVT